MHFFVIENTTFKMPFNSTKHILKVLIAATLLVMMFSPRACSR